MDETSQRENAQTEDKGYQVNGLVVSDPNVDNICHNKARTGDEINWDIAPFPHWRCDGLRNENAGDNKEEIVESPKDNVEHKMSVQIVDQI